MLPAGSDVLHCRSPTKSTPLDMFNCSASAGVLQVRKRTWPKKPTGRIAKQRRDVPPTPGTSIASIGSSTKQTRAGGPPFFRAGHSSQDKELLQELTVLLSAEHHERPLSGGLAVAAPRVPSPRSWGPRWNIHYEAVRAPEGREGPGAGRHGRAESWRCESTQQSGLDTYTP